jgi:hypothetical protein
LPIERSADRREKKEERMDPVDDRRQPDDAPPFGRSWTTLYLVVLGSLALWITLFTLFSRHFR